MNREILFRGKLDWYWDGINILYAEEAYKDGGCMGNWPVMRMGWRG